MKFFDYLEEQLERAFVVVYTGRFCPPHNGHISVYKQLQQKFGADRVYILTSDKSSTSPLTFEQKVELFKMFGVKPNMIKKLNSAGYNGPAIMDTIGKPMTYGLIVAIGEKDQNRIATDRIKKDGTPGYFRRYVGKIELPASEGGYVFIIKNEMSGDNIINASAIREAIKNNDYNAVAGYLSKNIFEKAKEMFNAVS